MKTFYPLCDDHEHSHFRRIILDGQVLVGEKVSRQMNNGGSARVRHLRDGLIRVGSYRYPLSIFLELVEHEPP
jgi:hypothetical protein